MEIRSEKRTEGTDQSAGCVASGEEETFSESPLFYFSCVVTFIYFYFCFFVF